MKTLSEHLPVVMVLAVEYRGGKVADVPEFRAAIVAATHHQVLPVRVKVNVADGIAVSTVQAVHCTLVD